MTPRIPVLLIALSLAAPAFAQNPHGRQRDPGGATQGGGDAGPRQAAPRNDPPRESAPPPPPAPAAAPAPRSSGAPEDTGGRAVDRRRDPDADSRRAVPRTGPVPLPGRDRDRGSVYASRPRVYNYYYPRYAYPYGYGGFGLGYFYYDPYVWGPAYGGYYDPYYYGGGGPGYYAEVGELRLEVRPREAEVYVDGYYAGRVDDFDGIFQALKLEEGPHAIRIVAPGFEPLDFNVRIYPGRKISYRGDLLRGRP